MKPNVNCWSTPWSEEEGAAAELVRAAPERSAKGGPAPLQGPSPHAPARPLGGCHGRPANGERAIRRTRDYWVGRVHSRPIRSQRGRPAALYWPLRWRGAAAPMAAGPRPRGAGPVAGAGRCARALSPGPARAAAARVLVLPALSRWCHGALRRLERVSVPLPPAPAAVIAAPVALTAWGGCSA